MIMRRGRWRPALVLLVLGASISVYLLLYKQTGGIIVLRQPDTPSSSQAALADDVGPLPASAGWMDRHAAIRRVMQVPQVLHEPTRPPLNRTLVIAVDGCVHSTCDFLKPGRGFGPDCPLPCTIVGDGGVSHADVVLLNAMEHPPGSRRPPGQLWIGAYQESPDHYWMLRGAALDQYDYTYGYSPHDDFIVTEHLWDLVWHADPLSLPLPSFGEKRSRPWLSVWITNCKQETTGRSKLLQRLKQQGVSMASYGSCGHTHDEPAPEELGGGNWSAFAARGYYEHKISVSSRHLFFFAAENSACSHYHTEKVYHGLLSGSVPVYLGASATLAPLVPPGSVIYADDYDGPGGLAKHLRSLASDERAYGRMLEWRSRPLPPAMRRFVELAAWEYEHEDQVRCELCQFLHRAPRRLGGPRPPHKCPDKKRKQKKGHGKRRRQR